MNATQLSRFNFHDARILRMSCNFKAATAEINFSYYPSPNARTRRKASVTFVGVTKIKQLADFEELMDHANAGNVVSWKPAAKRGRSFIYLFGGVIEITAKSVRVKVKK